jgi:predicted ATPase
VASFEWDNPPLSGTILNPDPQTPNANEINEVSTIVRSVVSYELNPSAIEQPNDLEHDYISREGFGVAGFIANLKDTDPQRFASLENRLKQFRPETESIDVWASGKLFWGLRDKGQERAFPAVHLSWGDRQLVGLLCVLYSTKPGATIAIEEIDRGFHHSRYASVIELLSEAAYDGLDGNPAIQIVVTTHSPSFVNKLGDRLKEIRLVTRSPRGGPIVKPLQEVAHTKLGTDDLDTPIGEIWETGLLEDVLEEAMT